MSLVQRIIGALIRPVVRRRARGKSLEGMIDRLEASRRQLESRMAGAKDTPGNREAINHIVGIERWGQSRLKVAQGAPLELDSYRRYRLPDGAELAELQAAFSHTRAESLNLARELAAAGTGDDLTIEHNDLGDLTPVEWLVYLDDHAKRESLRIR